MKKTFIILIAFFFINTGFSQGIKVLYSRKHVVPQKMLDDNANYPLIIKNLLKEKKKIDYFTLIHFNNESLYYPISKLEFKDVIEKMNLGDTTVVKGKIINIGVTKTVIYKNFKKDSLRNELTFAGKNYSIKDKIPNFNWQYTNDTKMVKNITLKKAVGTYQHKVVTAWYAESIPVKNGPYYYAGLPGLILELKFAQVRFKAVNIKYLKENPKIRPPKNLQPYITDKELYENITKLR
ncbi:MAG: GLPGLI family protein [Flavobacteriaceae bacterium]|nr:GLPGLI family protein [Flavobacteriaceae bacterium]